MKLWQRYWVQMLVLSLGFSVLLSIAVVWAMYAANRNITETIRRNIFVPVARLMESMPYSQAMQTYANLTRETPSLQVKLWVLDQSGRVLDSNTGVAPPPAWHDLPKPQAAHAMSFKPQWVRSNPNLLLMRLRGNEPRYLLFQRRNWLPGNELLYLQLGFCFVVSCGSLLLGLAMTSLYMRRNSREARDVLARIQQGELSARFRTRRFDQIGHLMLDFNAMADEIESLVRRLEVTESTRRHLLEELSHDLRTPLTSLSNAITILADHDLQLEQEHRNELLDMARAELTYFKRLLEDLFFIADLESPGHSDLAQRVDLQDLVQQEVRSLQMEGAHADLSSLRWQLDLTPAAVCGDPHLLRRLIRNSLENARRFASTTITIRILSDNDSVGLIVEDDGPGMSEQDIRAFGLRRKQRKGWQDKAGAGLSLGLGSVIMKTIVDLHGGTLEIESCQTGNAAVSGTRFHFRLPQARENGPAIQAVAKTA